MPKQSVSAPQSLPPDPSRDELLLFKHAEIGGYVDRVRTAFDDYLTPEQINAISCVCITIDDEDLHSALLGGNAALSRVTEMLAESQGLERIVVVWMTHTPGRWNRLQPLFKNALQKSFYQQGGKSNVRIDVVPWD